MKIMKGDASHTWYTTHCTKCNEPWSSRIGQGTRFRVQMVSNNTASYCGVCRHPWPGFPTEAEARAHYLGQAATAAMIQPTADQAKKNLDKFLDSHLPKPKPAFDIFKINREFS